MIQEFVEGKTLKTLSTSNLKKLAVILKEVHCTVDLRRDRRWDEQISRWTQKNILLNSKLLSGKFYSDMNKLYTVVLARLEEIKSIIKNYSRVHLIHNDVIPENIIESKQGDLTLIDWEFATYDYSFFEFGCLLGENHLSGNQEQVLLREYGFGMSKNERKIVQAVKIRRILSSIGWLIERIVSINNGKTIFIGEKLTKYQNQLVKQIKYIHSLLLK